MGQLSHSSGQKKNGRPELMWLNSLLCSSYVMKITETTDKYLEHYCFRPCRDVHVQILIFTAYMYFRVWIVNLVNQNDSRLTWYFHQVITWFSVNSSNYIAEMLANLITFTNMQFSLSNRKTQVDV